MRPSLDVEVCLRTRPRHLQSGIDRRRLAMTDAGDRTRFLGELILGIGQQAGVVGSQSDFVRIWMTDGRVVKGLLDDERDDSLAANHWQRRTDLLQPTRPFLTPDIFSHCAGARVDASYAGA
jgi:hypothetical protein